MRAARRLRRRGLPLALLAVGIVVLKADSCSKEDFFTPLTFSGGGEFTVSLNVPAPGWFHDMPGVSSLECKVIRTTPAQAGATFSATVTGPTEGGASGVLTAMPVTGTLDANGAAQLRVRINRLGTYSNVVTVTVGSVQRTATQTITVLSAPNTCPTP